MSGPLPRAATGPMPQADGGWRGDGGWQERGGRPPADRSDGGYDRSYEPRDRSYESYGEAYGRDDYNPSYAGYDGSYEAYNQPYGGYDRSYEAYQPPAAWDGDAAETDPGLRYRDPGPGMPGYRGSREHRYGGDRRR
jgi:hypothetical protein